MYNSQLQQNNMSVVPNTVQVHACNMRICLHAPDLHAASAAVVTLLHLLPTGAADHESAPQAGAAAAADAEEGSAAGLRR
jgi:hypothetical protein